MFCGTFQWVLAWLKYVEIYDVWRPHSRTSQLLAESCLFLRGSAPWPFLAEAHGQIVAKATISTYQLDMTREKPSNCPLTLMMFGWEIHTWSPGESFETAQCNWGWSPELCVLSSEQKTAGQLLETPASGRGILKFARMMVRDAQTPAFSDHS